ncbi:tyrosinase family protein [Streptomyces sp. CA-249302]|uniref:tyrosinase family protein n=1 Tax=Streptomyces sp. CA-249302 TaxID=3240058 RepID=UPI003D8A3ABC
MAVVRKNFVTDQTSRDDYVRGVGLLKREESQFSTADFNIPGPTVPVHTYDLFVIWHGLTMMTPVPPGGNPLVRNAAHRGPVFLPWHRVMLAVLEANLQRVLGKAGFALPYWDWAADGDLGSPAGATIWTPGYMGGQGTPVADGPFAFDPADPDSFRVRFESDLNGMLVQTERGLNRDFGRAFPAGWPTLPTSAEVKNALAFTPVGGSPADRYDTLPFNASSEGFRNRVEGFVPRTPTQPVHLHNQVHLWVGGDMTPATSPNDPVFFLNHCNEDRIWEGWMNRYGRLYAPDMTAPAATFKGERIDDPIVSPLGPTGTPRSVLDISAIYTYDVLP